MTFSVFGKKPQDSIYLADLPYAVRWNCKDGGLFVGGFDDDSRKSKTKESIDISIIKVSKFFGSLGNTVNELWFQLFYVPGPSVTALPKNQVCVSYIKKQSINNLMATVSEAMESGEPAAGIFTGSFLKQSGNNGVYYTIGFSWRERKGEAELKQLDQIDAFMSSNPALIDLSGTRDMVCIDGLSGLEIAQIVESARMKAALEGSSTSPVLPPAR